MPTESSEDHVVMVTKANRRSRLTAGVLLLLSFGLIGIAASQLLKRHTATTGTAPLPDASITITEDTSEPDEAAIPTDDYQVPADQPRLIKIPAIAVSGPIQKVGITKDNSISVPSNITFAGWYTGSVKPGETGLSIIDGHVSGKYADGIFKHLANLKVGDTFIVEYGDKTQKNFEVIDIKTLPESDSIAFLLAKRDDVERQLNLITCGGKFNRDTQRYNDRTIVVAKLNESNSPKTPLSQ